MQEMDVPSFFKYAFGPDYNVVEKYIPSIMAAVPCVVKEAVDASSCADFCNYSRFDAIPSGIPHPPIPSGMALDLLKSAAAFGFHTDDPVTAVLEAVASGMVPEFRVGSEKVASSDVDDKVARKLARKYAMYKIAAICAAIDRAPVSLNEDDVIFVSAAQDIRRQT